jgi:hypothetical protein
MADVTAAMEQDQIADSLLGDQPSEATTDTTTAGPEAEVVEQAETQPEAEQTETEESAEDWLPTEQDRTFSDDALLRYAARYQKDANWLSDPLNRQLLTDKLNSDIYLRQQQEQQPLEELEQELPQEQQQEEGQPLTLEQHLTNLNQWSERHTDPRIAQEFGNQFLKAFGVNEPAKPETAKALAQTMGTFGINLMQTALPQILAQTLDQVMPGFSGMYYQSARASSWDTVRNSSEQYSGLPAYGSKEFVELCAQLDSEYPALTEMGMALERANGGQLHGPAAEKFYGTLAKLATRPQADSQLLQQAAQAGARSARRGEVRRSAGNLGSGQSKGAIQNTSGSSKFQTNSDLFDDEAMAIWQKEHGRM